MGENERESEIREAVDELLDNLGFVKAITVPGKHELDRTGVYVLFLEGASYYVGLAENIGKRLRQHLAGSERTNRVEQLRFLPARRSKLRKLEQDVLALVEDAGAPVMNIDLARRSAASLAFDDILSRERQDIGISNPESVRDAAPRRDLSAQRSKHRDRFARFLELREAHDAAAFLSMFVPNVIPSPRSTEGEYYLVSCLPSTGGGSTIVRVSAGRQELAAMCWGRDGRTFYYVQTPVISLRRTLAGLLKRHDGLSIQERAWRAGGQDQGAVVADSLADLRAFLGQTVVAQQLRRFSLRIVRGGRAFWRNSHCPQLLDGVL